MMMLLRTLTNAWRKAFRRPTLQTASSSQEPGSGPSADAGQNQSVVSELDRVQGEIENERSRDAELLDALNQRIAAMDAASAAANREIQELKGAIADASARQEQADTRIRQLRERQDRERQAHQVYVQESMARERRQNRRLGWSMLLACCALLLGLLAGTVSVRDGREYAGLLADLSRDIKVIKAAIESQAASLAAQGADVPPAAASTPQGSRVNVEKSAIVHQDMARQPPDIAATLSHYHPHNKYRNRQEMRAFFTENATEVGVISVAEGLQYRVVDRGAGKSPGTTDTVVLDYSAFLLDGTQVFSSYDEPLPVQFSVNQLVPGLREVVPRMEEGARWEVYVSPDYAYRGGTRKRKRFGYEPLVYVVELRSVLEDGNSTL
jgi:FKBP-type peptidyl-prolyl cis-trans isomerase